MAPKHWIDAKELLRYLATNWPFDVDEPFEAREIPLQAQVPGGDAPLHFVAAWDDVRGIELLIQAGAQIDARGDMSYTALATAVARGNVAAAKALLAHGASPHIRTEFGKSPCESALSEGTSEMKELFRAYAT